MKSLKNVIESLITVSEHEMNDFLKDCFVKEFKKKTIISYPDVVPHEIYFVDSGIIRVKIIDRNGTEHTVHFALEHQFIADYSSFMQRLPAIYYLEALEDTRVIVLPRTAIERGYQNMEQGDKLGRLIAESYFIYHDNRIKNMYYHSPKERYDIMNEIFPNIHNRVPQHMIASYIGITPIHLSRLKKENKMKT